MKRVCLIFFATLLAASLYAQKDYKKAYTIFDAEGKEIGYETLIKKISSYNV